MKASWVSLVPSVGLEALFRSLSFNKTSASLFRHLKLMILRELSYWNQVKDIKSEPPKIIFEIIEGANGTSAAYSGE